MMGGGGASDDPTGSVPPRVATHMNPEETQPPVWREVKARQTKQNCVGEQMRRLGKDTPRWPPPPRSVAGATRYVFYRISR